MICLCGALVLFLLTAVFTFVISHKEKKPLSDTRFMLDTICSVTLYDWNGDGSLILDGAFRLCGSCHIVIVRHSTKNDVTNGTAGNIGLEALIFDQSKDITDISGNPFVCSRNIIHTNIIPEQSKGYNNQNRHYLEIIKRGLFSYNEFVCISNVLYLCEFSGGIICSFQENLTRSIPSITWTTH